MKQNEWNAFASAGVASTESEAGRIDEAVLYRRIALKVVPLLMLGYFISYVDRVNVGFAKLQMLDALGFSESVYGVGASAFFWGYLIMQVPASLAIYRFGVRRCLPVIMCLWGASSAAMMPASVLLTVPRPFSQQAEYRSSSISPKAGAWLRLRQSRPAQLYSRGIAASPGKRTSSECRCARSIFFMRNGFAATVVS